MAASPDSNVYKYINIIHGISNHSPYHNKIYDMKNSREEERKLCDPGYHKQLALCIFEGYQEYLNSL